MKIETRDRIESLLKFQSITDLRENINDIADVLLDDGFTYKDVKEFITTHLDEILGYDSKYTKFLKDQDLGIKMLIFKYKE